MYTNVSFFLIYHIKVNFSIWIPSQCGKKNIFRNVIASIFTHYRLSVEQMTPLQRHIIFAQKNSKHLCKYRYLDAPSLNYTQFYFLKWTIKNKDWTCPIKILIFKRLIPKLKNVSFEGKLKKCSVLSFCFYTVHCTLHWGSSHKLNFFFSHSALHISLWILTQAQRLSTVPVLSHSALCIALRILKQAPELQVVLFKLTHIHPLPSAVVLEHQWLPQYKHYFQDGTIIKKFSTCTSNILVGHATVCLDLPIIPVTCHEETF